MPGPPAWRPRHGCRPEHRREQEFRIGALEQQEIAQPHLAAGADHQIHIRLTLGIQVTLMPPMMM